jgi:pyruvate kinase
MQAAAWHRTKIVCTLGPATDARDVMVGLIRAGMDVARVNMSHGTHEDHARRIALVREVAREFSQPVAILADLPGPKFRLSALEGGARTLQEGMRVALSAGADDATALPVRNRELLTALRKDEVVYLADGSVELRVRATGAERVECEVVIGGTVRSGSGINVPEADLGGLVPTQADNAHLAFALSQAVEWIGVSFVQSADDLARVRSHFTAGSHALLMSKIEKRRALRELDAIVDASDGVMVARGDLGVETDLAEIPLVQKRIIAAANARSRPVITATQMLESMIEHEHPTRAEVTDVANAVIDGTDAVMLSGETAVGKYPVAAVQILNRVLTATESEYARRTAHERLQARGPHEPALDARAGRGPAGDEMAFVACQLAVRTGAAAIIASVHDVARGAAVARFRPEAPIVLIAPSQALCRALSLVRGVAPLCIADTRDAEHCIAAASEWLRTRGLAAPGAPAVLLLESPGAAAPDTVQMVRLR